MSRLVTVRSIKVSDTNAFTEAISNSTTFKITSIPGAIPVRFLVDGIYWSARPNHKGEIELITQDTGRSANQKSFDSVRDGLMREYTTWMLRKEYESNNAVLENSYVNENGDMILEFDVPESMYAN
jgi:hypothetical protein